MSAELLEPALQFVPGGPRVPARVLHALEEERLVFFCGAGISIGTGLPDFRQLTLDTVAEMDRLTEEELPADPAIHDAYCYGLYDKALNILEDREGIADQGRRRPTGFMRRFVMERLCRPPVGEEQEGLRLHRALLALARLRGKPGEEERGYHLVTTNYDDRFELADLPKNWIRAAPFLERPHRDRLSHVVFLHGRTETEEHKEDPRGRRLVLTSADFGDAYLRDGYATRFVLELFREFTVVFIGYSLNDPVMRYLMDIFSTESGTEGQFREAYAFVAHGRDDAEHQGQLWTAKHVRPILYDKTAGDRSHAVLTETLGTWAMRHASGQLERLQVLLDTIRRPYQAGADEDAVAMVAWALAEKSGATAKRLATYEPADGEEGPDVSWFWPLLDAQVLDPREASYRASTCQLHELDEVAISLCQWSMKHLNTPAMVLWAIESNHLKRFGKVQWYFLDCLSRELARNSTLGVYGTFWQLIRAAAAIFPVRRWDVTDTLVKGLPPTIGELQLHLVLEALRPRLLWPELPWSYSEAHVGNGDPSSVRDLARFKIGFEEAEMFSHRFFDEYEELPSSHIPLLLDELTSHLAEACRIDMLATLSFRSEAPSFDREYLAEAEEYSMEPCHVILDGLTLAFLQACTQRPLNAEAALMRWLSLANLPSHALFGRLHLWGAALLETWNASTTLEWLLCKPEWLWCTWPEKELLVFLEDCSARADRSLQRKLVEALLDNPPNNALHGSLSPEGIDFLRGERLFRLRRGGGLLEGKAGALVRGYERKRTADLDWPMSRAWLKMEGFAAGENLIRKPIGQILEAILRDPAGWGQSLDRFERARRIADGLRAEPARIGEAMRALLAVGSAPDGTWSGLFEAFESLLEDESFKSRTAEILELLSENPHVIASAGLSCARWLRAAAGQEAASAWFWSAWDLALANIPPDEPSSRLDAEVDLTTAINAPGGILAEALLRRIAEHLIASGSRFGDDERLRLTRLMTSSGKLGLHARLVAIRWLDWLYTRDAAWAQEQLLPRLQWTNGAEEAATLWRTWFRFARGLSPDLAAAFRTSFLDTLSRRAELGDQAHNRACRWFAVVAFDVPTLLTEDDIKRAFAAIGSVHSREALSPLVHRLRRSERAADLWRELIGPWLVRHWPKGGAFRAKPILTVAAEMLIETEEAFPDALEALEGLELVGEVERGSLILFRLTAGEQNDEKAFPYARRFPREVARWLDKILPMAGLGYEKSYLDRLVDAIEEAIEGEQLSCLQRLKSRSA